VVAAREVPYRPLVAVPDLSHGDPDTGNLLIQGDNLGALKSLLPLYAGRVKCIFIDPPYNTGSAFEHYDDNREHSIWLSLMYPRLELLGELLAEDGSIWVTIDDNEGHYLKVIMDEVFGRGNFVANVVWEKSDSPKMDSQYFSSRHDHLLVYARSIGNLEVHRIKVATQTHYNRVDDLGRRFYTKPLRAMGSGEDTRNARPSMFFPLMAPDGTEVLPMKPDGTEGRWRWGPDKVREEADRIDWVQGKNGWVPYYRILEETSGGRPPETIWPHSAVGSNRTSKAEVKAIFGAETTFTTPKPEGVIAQTLEIATSPGDLILDSFLGSGTTAAVAHKMGRRWIGVEMGEHAQTHCAARLRKVIEGEQGGISKAVGWQGGGGFRFCRLGEPVFDGRGSIRPEVGFADLARWVWYRETRQPLAGTPASPLLGVHQGTAYYLLYNGILGDRRPEGGNVLTGPVLAALPPFEGPRVVFGEACRLHATSLAALGLRFRQLPYQANA